MSDDIIKRLREAIAAGPTPGPWRIRAERYRFIHVYATGGGICHLDTVDGEGAANAKLIAAASPDNIAALLDRLDAAEAENERLRMELAHEEQRVADMMADVNRVGHENEALREDAERLDSGCIRLVDRDEFGESVATVYSQVDLRAAIDAARREK